MELKIFLLFLISRCYFLAISLVVIPFVNLQQGYLGQRLSPELPYWLWIWSNFDGQHFIEIVTQGYRNFNFAFFPLYPLTTWVVSNIFQTSPAIAGILLSILAFLLSIFMLTKIISLDYPKKIGYLSILIICFYPLSFFYHSVYSDALFLLFTITSFYFARRKNWLLAGLFGGFSGLTRLTGLAIIPALAIEWYLQNGKKVNLTFKDLSNFSKTAGIAAALSSLGIALYMLYQYLFFSDPLLFQKSMVAWSQSQWIFPLQVVFRYLKIFLLADKNQLVYWIAVLEFLTLLLYFVLSFYTAIKVRLSYGVFMLVLLSLVTFTGTFAGTPRYILHLFPASLALALILDRSNLTVKVLVFFTFLILGVILTTLFTRGYFIT